MIRAFETDADWSTTYIKPEWNGIEGTEFSVLQVFDTNNCNRKQANIVLDKPQPRYRVQFMVLLITLKVSVFVFQPDTNNQTYTLRFPEHQQIVW